MLERIAAQVLNRYIGRYVENINTENLSIGLLQGAVELENLPLKKDALRDLDIPGISLKSGHIGKVILRIASYKTIKEPWVIEIHRLSLVVGPGDSSENADKEKEEKKKAEQKQSDLDSLEEKWRAKHGENTSLYSVWYSYSSSIITTIMENLQFEIHDVHIRYEDDKTLLPQKYACGISIKHLIAKSTDENWIPTTGGLTVGEKIFKLLQLDGFSFYWETDAKMSYASVDLKNKNPQEGTDDEHKQEMFSLPGCDTSHFVLTPVSGQAKLMRNCSKLPLRSRKQPRISFDVTLGEISLCMGQSQYRQAIAFMSELSRADKREQNADGRPVESVMENPKLWWKWATEIHLKKIRRAHHRSSKSFLLGRSRDNVEYASLYKKLLNSKLELKKLTAPETSEIQQRMTDIENKMSFDEICVLREPIYESLDKELKKEEKKLKETKSSQQQKKGATKSWGSWISGWVSGWRSTESANVENEPTSSIELVPEDKSQGELDFQESVYKEFNEDDLYEFFGDELADQDTTDTFLKRDHVLLNLNFLMDGVTLSLYEDDSYSKKKMVEPFVGFEFKEVTVTSEWRPRYKSSEVKMDLGGIFISDMSDTKSHFRYLVKPQILSYGEPPHSPKETSMSMSSSFKGLFQLLSPNKVENRTSTQDKTPVFSLLYQNQPRTSTNQFANRLEVNSAPLSITFLPNLVERVNGFFKSPESYEILSELDDGLSATARDAYETWKVRSQAEIRRTVKRIMDGKTESNISQDRWAISLNISAPEVILPERILDVKSNIVIVNLGHMIFKNHNEDDQLSKWKPATAMKGEEMEKLVADDDDFMTPPDTPPSDDSTSIQSSASQSKKIILCDEVSESADQEYGQDESKSQQRLNEKLFYERMYEKYQIHFTDLQVLVAKSDDKWEATRALGKGPHHLVEKFSVDVLLERRNVFTFDPNCPAVKVKGNLPHLTIHISHSKMHSLFNCLDRVSQKLPTPSSSASDNNIFSPSKSTSSSKTRKFLLDMKPSVYSQEKNENHRKTVEEKSKSKQLLCQFSLNQISILLEESPASILSVLDVYRIQTEFTKRPYDHSAQLSIHSLLLADTKQELGHDFELLLASHRNVKMDLGSGNILDSGTVSPDQSVQSKSQENMTAGQQTLNTNSMLSTVAENLGVHQLNLGNDMTGSVYQDFSGSGNFDGSYLEACEDLITFEWNYLSNSVENPGGYAADDENMQKHKQLLEKSPIFQKKTIPENSQNFIFIKFNSLDLVLNLKTWVALLDFLHHLKPDDSKPDSDNVSQSQGLQGPHSDTGDLGERGNNVMPDAVAVEGDDTAATMEVFLEFRKLNVLLLRHIKLPGKMIGRKVATLTMHNAEVHTSVGDQDKSKNKSDFITLLDVQGSVGSLGMQDLTNADQGIPCGRQVLSLGELADPDADPSLVDFDYAAGESETGNLKTQVPLGNRSSYDDLSDLEQTEAFSFVIKKGSVVIPRKEILKRTNSDLMFQMDTEEINLTEPREEVIANLRLASVLYMHSPRLIAEILALVEEAGEITSDQMASDTRQAYKDMAYSIMDKSIAVLGKSMHPINVNETVPDSATPVKDSSSPPSLFKLTVEIQTPIVALPKCQGSFELLVGNLGKITIKNDHALNRYNPEQEALDVLHIDVMDMNVTSKRQVEEEVKAKLTPDLKRKTVIKKVSSGPSLAKLKLSSSKFNPTRDTQILHETCIKLTVVKEPFVPSPRKPLDVRNPDKKSANDSITEPSDEVYDGPIGEMKMCVAVELTMPLTVTLSKPAYEQVLKTLDHISYGGNIDTDDIKDAFEDDRPEFLPRSKNQSQLGRSVSETSQQSTPSHLREFQLFTAPGLEITPKTSNASKLSIMTQRKYTPLAADISIPCLVLQLNEDFSEGEQGVVKVTLEGFSAKFEKENRSTTHLDLTLGSVDVEDLLKEENSPHRHIVVSYSRTSRDRQSAVLNNPDEYLSTSCPGFVGVSNDEPGGKMSTSLPATGKDFEPKKMQQSFRTTQGGVFRPFDAVDLSSGPFGSCQATHDYQIEGRSRTTSNEQDPRNHVAPPSEKPLTPPCSPTSYESPNAETKKEDETLVRIQAFLVDGNSLPYEEIYSRINRRINIDFNSLDCKVNLQTWVVLLDFFGIGTSPKKTYNLDPKTEEELNWDRRLAVSSYYENQPDDHINSEIDFKVRSFSLIFNKEEYEFVKANISKFETHVRIRDGILRVSGQLGSLSVSDLSPNGAKYRERFVFAGQKAMDFDIEKYDDYDYELDREYDIRVKLRMSVICYTHTQRFHQELIAYLLHFQQLQEVLGRMRAASVGQTVRDASCRQARVLLDIKASSPVILLPESSHSDRLIVADLGHMTVQNSFKRNGSPGTLSHSGGSLRLAESGTMEAPLSPGSKKCLLDVLHADLDQMDLFTAFRTDNRETEMKECFSDDKTKLIFSSFIVTKDSTPLLKEKLQLSLEIERNLEKETVARTVPDTSVSGQMSSVYCTVDLTQYWLVRGILDHNLGEPIPEFPQPTAFLQPSTIQTVLSGSVYTGMSVDMHMSNVSVELLERHETMYLKKISLARLDYVKSRLSYRSYSDQTKTVNLSCEAFVASDTRWPESEEDFYHKETKSEVKRNLFSTVFGPTNHTNLLSKNSKMKPSNLQFELQYRAGPDFMYFTALLVEMRVYLIMDWLSDVYKYIIVNPDQPWCDSLRAKASELLDKYGQVVPGQEQEDDPDKRENQFKINVTNTDFVLVENCSRFDSDAVILRSTAVLHHHPNSPLGVKRSQELNPMKIMTCTLQSIEVFSCQLDCENETALSIVDPVTVNIEVDSLQQRNLTNDEINFDPSLLDKNKLDIHISELNTRISYNDLLLFLAIAKALPLQKEETSSQKREESPPTSMKAVFRPSETAITRLAELGYSRDDIISSLQNTGGSVEHSAEWLLQNAKIQSELLSLQSSTNSDTTFEKSKVPFDIGKVFLHVDSACVCLIDDCAENCDVPLAELALRSLTAEQNLSQTHSYYSGTVPTCYAGKANLVLTGDYYNRMLSLWEPYLEQWRCGFKWNYLQGHTASSAGRWDVKVQAPDRLDISVTSTLIETVKKTMDTWTTNFNRSSEGNEDLIDLGPSSSKSFSRKRQPFIPYVLRNLTGLSLRFATHISAMQNLTQRSKNATSSSYSSDNREELWTDVMPGESHSFRFQRAEKQRHKRSEKLILHQIVVKVGEWETLSPVTISKVGVYFRHSDKEINKSSHVYRTSDPVRVVFAVTLEGSAQKVVTVRSALVVRSKVKIPIQIHLEQNDVDRPLVLPSIEPGGVQYIPLQLTNCGIKIKPLYRSKLTYRQCSQTIKWRNMKKDLNYMSDLVTCPSEQRSNSVPFRFSVCIKKKLYPDYEEVAEKLVKEQAQKLNQDQYENTAQYNYIPPHMPGHTIVVLPPVVVSNLLPCDLHYYFKNTEVAGKLSPGQDATLHTLHLAPGSQNHPPLLLGCGLEGFNDCRELNISHIAKDSQMRMVMVDHHGRNLILNVRIFWRLGCSVKISVMSGYWIVNKTGLPIIVKQDGARSTSAGQYEEHERARSITPLMFSYSDRDLPYLCTMRLGKETEQRYTQSNYPHASPSSPSFCQSFSIDGGTCTRNMLMINHDNRPNRVYYIGLSVRRGWGRYRHTHIVTVAPRFLLVNLTRNHTLSFAQHHATSFTQDSVGMNQHLTIISGSSIVFHWPRADLDRLLCARLTNEKNCRWSGGFIVDQIDAFHIHLRLFGSSKGGSCSIFLRVEITLVDATYRISFYDGDVSSCPSPLRFDNISPAPLVLKQVDTDDGLTIDVAPESQVPYACDEPCLPPLISCMVKGGSSSVILNMDDIGFEKLLYYENYIYIVVGQSSSDSSLYHHITEKESQLVLEVEQVHYDQSVDGTGHSVKLGRRRAGKRNQLWRMTSEGLLIHEGSSPPTAGNRNNSSSEQGMVLDIAEMQMGKEDILPLTIRRAEPSRRSQRWKFTEDGRLCSSLKNLCVQVSQSGRVGIHSFVYGGIVTPNQYCTSEKMIAGSGVLALKVVRDGPTRVIRIVDIRQKRAGILTVKSSSSGWSLVKKNVKSHKVDLSSLLNPDHESKVNSQGRMMLSVDMTKGVGVSLVNNLLEELLYLTMSGVHVEATFAEREQSFSLRIQKIQIDNQLFGGFPPVMLCQYRSSSGSASSSQESTSTDPNPALTIDAVKIPSSNSLYEIYNSLTINLGRICLQLEERLILKLYQFFGSDISSETDQSLLDETKMDLIQNMKVTKLMNGASKRYYFDSLKFNVSTTQLSVFTASKLDPELKAIKQSAALVLIQFERAPVVMQAYERKHVFESIDFILDEAKKHFTDQLKGQAARILGSVDFLGNPLGLISDVRAGVGSLARGSVPSLVKHLTHGISDSAAKVTGTLSALSGGITMDQDHEEKRRMIRANSSNPSDHLVSGLHGLATGLVGGLTSIVTQTVRGTTDDGAKGFFKGFGKGLIGTVTKPVTGVLDFASETASFVRDSSMSSNHSNKKVRLPRISHSFQGCLEPFSESNASYQLFLHSINGRSFDEWLYSVSEIVMPRSEKLLVLITNKHLYLTKHNDSDPDGILLQVDYYNLVSAQPHRDGSWYIELTMKMGHRSFHKGGTHMHYSSSGSVSSRSGVASKKPRILCHSESVAKRICEHINYANMLASEQSETLPSHNDDTESDKAFDLEV